MSRFESFRLSHPLLRSARLPKRRENGPEIRAFANSSSSPNAGSAEVKADIAESLRPYPQIFPFWRDYGRSLVRSRLPPGMVIDSPKGVSCGVTLNPVKTAVKGRKKQLLTPDVQLCCRHLADLIGVELFAPSGKAESPRTRGTSVSVFLVTISSRSFWLNDLKLCCGSCAEMP
jgi:hypothetical protein